MTRPFFCTCGRNYLASSLYCDCETKGRNTIRMLVKVSANRKFGYVHGIKDLLIGSRLKEMASINKFTGTGPKKSKLFMRDKGKLVWICSWD